MESVLQHRTDPAGRSRANPGRRARWREHALGLDPVLAKGIPPKYGTINARIETVETAASYRGPWARGQRCIQVASGFYEWHTRDDGRKVPYYIHALDQPVFGFAALWDRSRKDDGEVIESVVHITMPGNELLRDIHNGGANPYRMPAILHAADLEAWLSGSIEEARAVLRPYEAGLMTAYPVGLRVNTPKNDDAALLERIDPDAAKLEGVVTLTALEGKVG